MAQWQIWIDRGGATRLSGNGEVSLATGDIFILEKPGGGDFGKPTKSKC